MTHPLPNISCRIIEYNFNNKMVKCEDNDSCEFYTCSVDDDCGTIFTVSTARWEIGRAVAITDPIFLKYSDKTVTHKDKTIKVIKRTFENA